MRASISKKRLILLEFNELCPDLLQRWMLEGKLPNFKKFHDSSQVFVAQADTQNPDHLEPWIQWYSLHTGLSYDQHGVFHLTDGPSAGYTDVWQALLSAGHTVASCASMNVSGITAPGSFFMPDPWCNTEAPHPAELSAYQSVIQSRVQENSNASSQSLGKKAYIDLLRFLIGHGLRASTVKSIVSQLLADALRKDGTDWKRVALLDQLQFDVFRHYWLRNRYDFSSFFLNSTAHFQHAYWHLAFPESFASRDEVDESDTRRSAILYGYQQMDGILGRFRELEQQGAMLILTTALSQQPNPKSGNRYYRVRDVASLLSRLGVSAEHLMPVMAHQYSARFESIDAAQNARTALEEVRLEGRQVFEFSSSPENTVFFGNGLRQDIPEDATLEIVGNESWKPSYYEIFYKIPHTKSGIHHPDSVLWFKTDVHATHQTKVSILDILPTVLDYYGESVPTRDGLVRGGRSLLPMLNLAPTGASSAPLATAQIS